MKTKNTTGRYFLRGVALLCALVLVLLSFSSCKARRLSPTADASRSVGQITVTLSDGNTTVYDIPYEEFYFLAKTFESSVKAEKGTAEYNEALMELISTNITANYAILALCEEMDVEYDEGELRSDVKDEVESFIDDKLGGSRKEYLLALDEIFLTDNYYRFMLGVDLLYNKLPLIYAQNQMIPTGEKEIIEFIKENFICTKHVAIINDEGDDAAKNLETAEYVRQLLTETVADTGERKWSINELIGGKPINANEDLLISYNGYYFTRGMMDEPYETAAFGLEIGEVSQVVKSRTESNMGIYTDVYYVIERMPLDDEYIDKNFNELADSISDAVIVTKLDTLRKALEFLPNEYCLSLDLSDLEPLSRGVDMTVIYALVIIAVMAIATGVFAIIFVKARNKKIEATREQRNNSK